MDKPTGIYINIDHPCHEVDMLKPKHDWEAKGLRGQDYLPLEILRDAKALLSFVLRNGWSVSISKGRRSLYWDSILESWVVQEGVGRQAKKSIYEDNNLLVALLHLEAG